DVGADVDGAKQAKDLLLLDPAGALFGQIVRQQQEPGRNQKLPAMLEEIVSKREMVDRFGEQQEIVRLVRGHVFESRAAYLDARELRSLDRFAVVRDGAHGGHELVPL